MISYKPPEIKNLEKATFNLIKIVTCSYVLFKQTFKLEIFTGFLKLALEYFIKVISPYPSLMNRIMESFLDLFSFTLYIYGDENLEHNICCTMMN